MPQCCYLAKGAKRPSHTTNTIKFDRIPFDPCNSIKRFDLSPFDQKNSTYLQPPRFCQNYYYNVVRYVHIPLVPWMQERSGATCHMAMPQCCYLAKWAKRPSHTTNTMKFDRIPFDQKVWPLSFRPENFDLFTAQGCQELDIVILELEIVRSTWTWYFIKY